MKKLRNKSGETLIETLVALLIAILVLGFLATSIVTATKINKKVETMESSFVYPDESTAESETINITIKDSNNLSVGTTTAKQYTDDTGNYTYYKGVN